VGFAASWEIKSALMLKKLKNPFYHTVLVGFLIFVKNYSIMIRKLFHTLMVVFLLASSTGVTFYEHYCGGELEKISIYSAPDPCCGTDCNCCHNESFSVKIHDVFSATAFHFAFQPFGMTILVVLSLFDEQNKIVPQLISFVTDSPPPLSGQSILKSICVFRN
jgi:hypothetical protein